MLDIYSFKRLEALEFHQCLSREDHPDITENGIIVKVWVPLLEKLARRSNLRYKR